MIKREDVNILESGDIVKLVSFATKLKAKNKEIAEIIEELVKDFISEKDWEDLNGLVVGDIPKYKKTLEARINRDFEGNLEDFCDDEANLEGIDRRAEKAERYLDNKDPLTGEDEE